MISFPTNVDLSVIKNPFLSKNNISLSVLRLDKIHEEISGNKLFKLFYFLEECLQTNHKTILTFGGAYSNHLLATAQACMENNLKCIGIVRGEEPKEYSHTLKKCKEKGMVLHFIERELYKNNHDIDFINKIKKQYGDFTLVPEGGYNNYGAKGASHILSLIEPYSPTHICASVGTATTLAGLLLKNNNYKVIAVPAIKNMIDIEDRITELIGLFDNSNLRIFNEYHFGGYAKHNAELISFMNNFYNQYQIPTDIIYTAKMMYGILDKIEKGFFAKDSKIICIHTGGLQGNKSLKTGTLIF